MKNTGACIALINNRASIEEPNRYQETPLHVAARIGSLEVAVCLLQKGACPTRLDVWGRTPLILAHQECWWELVDLLTPCDRDMARRNFYGETLLHLITKFEPQAAGKTVSFKLFFGCIEQGASLYLRDSDGVAPVHWTLGSHSAHYLCSLLHRDCRFLRPHEMVQWPELCFNGGTGRLVAISKNLRLVRPFLSQDGLSQLSGITVSGNHSLLCRAACWGLVEAIQKLLALGLDMTNHHCNDHGSPLMAAVSNRQIEAVKCLARNGATVPYDLCQPSDSTVSAKNPDFVIREWLFVGRYLELRRISNGTAEASAKVESWAGVCTAKVALKWEWRRHRGETIWAYAGRRQRIIKGMGGRIVKCVGESTGDDGAGVDVTGGDPDEEFSGRYYCLGRGSIRGAGLVY